METNLRQNELVHLARLCVQEQGGSEAGVKGEASLMMNLARKHGRDVYEYVRNSGWFSRASYWMDNGHATQEQIDWVADVLINGNATLPPYVDEHDCLGDIFMVSNHGVRFDKYDRSQYIKDVTVIQNTYGAAYVFYCFLHEYSDPFGYTSKPADTDGIYLEVGT